MTEQFYQQLAQARIDLEGIKRTLSLVKDEAAAFCPEDPEPYGADAQVLHESLAELRRSFGEVAGRLAVGAFLESHGRPDYVRGELARGRHVPGLAASDRGVRQAGYAVDPLLDKRVAVLDYQDLVTVVQQLADFARRFE